MRTLVFHDGALGDVLLSLPCIRAIGRYAAAPDIVCREDAGRLLRSTGVVREAFSVDRGMFSSWYSRTPDHAAQELISRYSRAFVFTRKPAAVLAANIAKFVPSTQVIVTVPSEGDRTHVAEYRLRQLPADMQDQQPIRLKIPSAFRQQAEEVLARAGRNGRDLVVLHPGSGGTGKCWPLERYFELAEEVVAGTSFALFLSGPVEELTLKERIGQFVLRHTHMTYAANADLVLVAGLLAESRLYIGNDSGISHLAAAVGAPVIALFGPTDPALWRPWGETVRIISAETMAEIPVHAVTAAAGGRSCQAVPVSVGRQREQVQTG